MSIPASISISKMRLPETEEPVTRGRVTVDRGESRERAPVSSSPINVFHIYLLFTYQANALHAFSQGAVFGLVVAGQIL